MANVALKKILDLLWYLSEDPMVSYVFFNSKLPVQDIKHVVDKLKSKP